MIHRPAHQLDVLQNRRRVRVKTNAKRLAAKPKSKRRPVNIPSAIRRGGSNDALVTQFRRDRIRLRHGDELSLGRIVNVDVQLALEGDPHLGAHGLLFWVLARIDGDVERGAGFQDGLHDAPVSLHVKEQFAVWLDVGQRDALGIQHGLESADLVENHGVHVARVGFDLSAAEAEEVLQPGVRAHSDIVLLAEADRLEHDGGVAGVKSARNVCGVEKGYQLFVWALGVCVGERLER